MTDQLEILAAQCHDVWTRWVQPFLTPLPVHEARQLRASVTAQYADLPESEKEWRRIEARRLIEMVAPLCAQARADGEAAVEVRWQERLERLKALLTTENYFDPAGGDALEDAIEIMEGREKEEVPDDPRG
jgi:hypothetical protein